MHLDNFKNKTVLITGAASGIGRGLAQYAATLDMNIALMDLNVDGLQETQALIPDASSLILECDVSNFDQYSKCKAEINREFGVVHVLFNNAGIFLEGRGWKVTTKNWARIIDVNLMSVINGQNLFVEDMIQSGENCHVVNTASMAGLIVAPALSPYTTTKHAVVGLTRSLYLDLEDEKVTVSVLCPGFIKTNITEREHSGLNLSEKALDNHESAQASREWLAENVKDAMDPKDFAQFVFKNMDKKAFWIVNDPELVHMYKEYSKEITTLL
tara:strand:- start:84 stop:896 length:813 start_codon:yes stop_codon:yes gene_type:complete